MPLRSMALVAALVLALAGCSNPHDEPFPDTDKPVPERYTKALAKLSPEDKELLDGYFKRHVFEPGRARTIGDAISDQRGWLADEPRRRAQSDEARRQIDALVEVRVLERDRDTSKRGEPVRLKLAIQNLGTKAIRRVEGTFELDNGVQALVSKLELDVEVDPGKTVEWIGHLTTRVAGALRLAESLGNQPLERYTIVWKPSAVTLEDFTRVSVE
ncbi:MAG: hypothetical protein KF850_02385 [Labilithrix sp.]|nr:hypothetical protein [Labilithrix sp.]